MKKGPVLFFIFCILLLFFVVFSSLEDKNVFEFATEDYIDGDCEKNNCLALSVDFVTPSGKYVGDYFYYEFHVKNIGPNNFTSNLSLDLTFPPGINDSHVGMSQEFLVSLQENESYYYKSTNVFPIHEGRSELELTSEDFFNYLMMPKVYSTGFVVGSGKTTSFSIDFIKEREANESKVLFWFQIITLFFAIITIFITILSTLHANDRFRKQQEKEKKYRDSIQKDLIKSIETQLRCIDRDIANHKEQINKNPLEVPSYDICQIDAYYYVTNLRSNIRGYETETLKEALIILSNKIKEVNQILDLAQELDRNKGQGHSFLNPYISELKSANCYYYLNLERLVKDVRRDVWNILFHPKKE